jgi:hypothetical protein
MTGFDVETSSVAGLLTRPNYGTSRRGKSDKRFKLRLFICELARRLATSPGSNLEDVGSREGMGAPYAARLMRLNYLAPDIVVAILNGRQRCGLTARKLMATPACRSNGPSSARLWGSPEQAKVFRQMIQPATAAGRATAKPLNSTASRGCAQGAVRDRRTTQKPPRDACA